MTRTFVYISVVLAALLFATACGKGGNRPPTGPSPVDPPPTQNYEPIPADTGLVKPAMADNGQPISKMRAVLVSEPVPPRGSKIVLGPQNCLDVKCFQMSLRFEFDGIDNPAVGMQWEIYWSLDGKTPIGEVISAASMAPGVFGPKTYGPMVILTSKVPKYIVAKLSHKVGGTGGSEFKDPAEEGWVAFLLDYHL